MPSNKLDLGKVAQSLRQCQNCHKPEESGGPPLLICGSCKRQHYCSKECQKAHWKEHKEQCKMNTATRTLIKEASAAMKSSPDYDKAMDPDRLRSDLRLFTEFYRPVLHLAAYQALRLETHPANMYTECMLINLERRQSNSPEKRFSISEATVERLEDLLAAKQDSPVGTVAEAAFQRCKEMKESKNLYAMALIFIRAGAIVHLAPVGFPEKMGLGKPNPDWKNSLLKAVSAGMKV